jgi:prephenate dehydratase
VQAPPGTGALAPVTAARVYGLRVEAEGLEDEAGPSTRFVVLRSRCPAPTGRDRTFFVVTPRRDEPGSLVRLLQEFSVRGINLTTIESRPTRALLGEYRFLIECEGHVADAHVRDAVLGLLRFPGETRFLGSFPEDPSRRGHAPAPGPPDEALQGYERMLEQVEA